jgi:hypothetical protein
MRITIGRTCTFQRELLAYHLKDAEDGFNQTNADRIMETKNAIKNNLELLPTLDELQNMEINCERDVFLEVLIMAVKSSSLAHQHSFFMVRNA